MAPERETSCVPVAFSVAFSGTGSPSTADDFTGTINGSTATPSADGTSVNFSWSYQGSVSGFEIEEENQSDPGTNYAYVPLTINSPTLTTPTYTASTGTIPGDQYSFRIRADNTDGTASAYADSGQVNAPLPGSSDSNNGPPPPAVSVLATNSGGADNGGWYGVLSIVPPAIDDGWSVASVHRTDDPFNILNDSRLFLDVDRFDPQYYGDILADVEGTTGASYTMTFESYPPYGGSSFQPGHPGSPINLTTNGELPPAMSLQTVPGDPSTVTWEQPDNVDSGTVTFYYLAKSAGNETPEPIGTAALGDHTYTFSNLPDGTNTIFAVYTGTGDGGQISGYSPYSNNVQINESGPPAAPAVIRATAVMGLDEQGQVEVHWQNTSDNEAAFVLQTSLDGGTTWGDPQTLRLDQTLATEQAPSSLVPPEYRVAAKNLAATSQPSAPAAVPSVLTVHLWGVHAGGPTGPGIGHVSITLADGTYISWWPNKKDLGRVGGSWRGFADKSRTEQKDNVDENGGESNFHITGLNQVAIENWWKAYEAGHTEWKWPVDPVGPDDCATVVEQALRAGGASGVPSGDLPQELKGWLAQQDPHHS